MDGHSEVPDEYSVMPGDVTSHLAQSVTLEREKPIHVSLLHNPSHLEAVSSPVDKRMSEEEAMWP